MSSSGSYTSVDICSLPAIQLARQVSCLHFHHLILATTIGGLLKLRGKTSYCLLILKLCNEMGILALFLSDFTFSIKVCGVIR